MVSNKDLKKKREDLHEKLQLLRSITHSHSLDKTSIILDATKYIEELKEKVERLNQDIATAEETSKDQNHLPMVTVETLEKGFLINVYSGNSCPGLLVPILEVFEDMGLSVMEARVSCSDTFQFQAVGGEEEEGGDSMDAEAVTQAVRRVIKNWRESTSQQ
ncbi:hypothetical protein QN277_015709 [Acacia crassicarpa]|uniref:Plant bHLH transcription factor ACT-like domain-containing protein n=1 Tax=Acacia crassicarpa TaxID=499986 RepID=A0AAE1KMC2_9FABA|nr:hypothetical protein QN277_015709 [Acacia crassicarpa]